MYNYYIAFYLQMNPTQNQISLGMSNSKMNSNEFISIHHSKMNGENCQEHDIMLKTWTSDRVDMISLSK